MKCVHIEYIMIYKLFCEASHLHILTFSVNDCIFLKLKTCWGIKPTSSKPSAFPCLALYTFFFWLCLCSSPFSIVSVYKHPVMASLENKQWSLLAQRHIHLIFNATIHICNYEYLLFPTLFIILSQNPSPQFYAPASVLQHLSLRSSMTPPGPCPSSKSTSHPTWPISGIWNGWSLLIETFSPRHIVV